MGETLWLVYNRSLIWTKRKMKVSFFCVIVKFSKKVQFYLIYFLVITKKTVKS